MTQYATIAELQNFIVLNSYTKAAMLNETPAGYQTEAQLESELIADLRNQGYEYLPHLNSPQACSIMRGCSCKRLTTLCLQMPNGNVLTKNF